MDSDRNVAELCCDGAHYAYCGIYRPFTPCEFGNHWHHIWDGLAYRFLERCEAEEPCRDPRDVNVAEDAD